MAINGTLLGIPGVVGVWNETEYPCTLFRSDSVKFFFVLWPEMLNGVFKYCCQDGASNLSLVNFTYGVHQGLLDPRPYFDLGVVDTFLPYWYYWTFWTVPTKSIAFPLHCEYTDMHRLYVRRFWRKIIVLGAKTGSALVGILQLAVLILVVLIWGWQFCLPTSRFKRRKALMAWFFTLEWADLVAEWAHLILLAMIGGCMMEAIGHSSLHMWRASVMYNAGAVYSYLTAMAIVSSILRQGAVCILPPKSIDALAPKVGCGAVDRPKQRARSESAWKALGEVTDDWRWQKVFGQLSVLVLMGTYLALVDTDDGGAMDNVAGIVLAAVVAACIWSATVTTIVAFRSIVFMSQVWVISRDVLEESLTYDHEV